MKNLIVFVFCVVNIGNLFASFEKGNGGGGWACFEKDQDKSIRWAHLADFVEGDGLYKSESNDKNIYEIAEEKLNLFKKLSYTPSSWTRFDIKIDKAYELIQVSLTDEDDVDTTGDANYNIPESLKDSCPNGNLRYVQIANAYPSGKIGIDRQVFPTLPSIEQAALIVHETLYKVFREDGLFRDSNSDRTRKIVRELFKSTTYSKEEMFRLLNLPNLADPYTCRSVTIEVETIYENAPRIPHSNFGSNWVSTWDDAEVNGYSFAYYQSNRTSLAVWLDQNQDGIISDSELLNDQKNGHHTNYFKQTIDFNHKHAVGATPYRISYLAPLNSHIVYSLTCENGLLDYGAITLDETFRNSSIAVPKGRRSSPTRNADTNTDHYIKSKVNGWALDATSGIAVF